MLIETFLRKQLGLKAHTVTKVEETETFMVVDIDRLGSRLLRRGLCRQRCRKVHSMQRPRVWRDLSMRKLPLKLRYRPRRVECPRCGVRVEDFPWAEPWARRHGSLQCSSAARPRIELAGNGPPVRLELEECGNDREAGGAVWIETSRACRCMSLASMK